MKPGKIDALWGRAERGDAPAVIAEIHAAEPAPTPALLLEALCHGDLGDHQKSLDLLDRVLVLQPTNMIARLHRGITLYLLGRPREAAEAFRAGPLFPQDPFLRRFVRVFWPVRFADPSIARGGRDPLALTTVPDSPAPGSPEARRLARARSKAGVKAYLDKDIARAGAAFGEAHSFDPAQTEHALFFAWCLLHHGEGRRARAIIEPLVEDSLAQYRKAKSPDAIAHPHLICEHAWALHECGEHRQALALLSTVRPSGPDDYWAHIIAALCWTMLGEHKNADACLDIALGDYFLETWDQFLQPFLMNTISWLEKQ